MEGSAFVIDRRSK